VLALAIFLQIFHDKREFATCVIKASLKTEISKVNLNVFKIIISSD
jgi:hypothetical protein